MASIDLNEVLAWQVNNVRKIFRGKVIISVLRTQGTKTDTRENAVEVKKDMEKQRGQLLEGLAAKVISSLVLSSMCRVFTANFTRELPLLRETWTRKKIYLRFTLL